MTARNVSLLIMLTCLTVWALRAQGEVRPELEVSSTTDFEVNGRGDDPAWANAEWVELSKRAGDLDYRARFKVLYSGTGIYFLMHGTDSRVSATKTEDFLDLWNEDVFEVFLWTDERYPVYFEYEISPLDKELPILIPNFEGRFLGWRPWHYEGERRIRHAVSSSGGELLPGAGIESWSAEFFIPYALLTPLQNSPPRPGSRWRANLYRVDHDEGKKTAWDWSRVGPSFHEYRNFGTLIFR